MKDIVIWLIHTPAGIIVLVAAIIALFANKGAITHRKAGVWFTISMQIMLISGFIAAFIKESPSDMFLSVVVMYTVFTAWLTTYHKNNTTGLLEKVALVWILSVAVTGFYMHFSWHEAGATNPYVLWASLAVIFAIGDIRNIYRAGLSDIQRILRHVWRIGFSLLWAVLAFTDKIIKTLGSNVKELPIEQLIVIVGIPTALILIIIMYWFANILFFSRSKFTNNSN